ncbi:GNAT family N-acetyltransferase [Dokdonella sp.]|uniref:GNAT family N-acetyltransferase n=1 Tax=Dokdonella sp. TaxID=2291710 RepID=UPI003C5BFD19
MTIVIRDVREQELDSVLALNNAVGPRILALDATGMRWFFRNAAYFRVAEVDGVIAGFLIALREFSGYESSNFLWFRQRYPEFAYIDRIVIAEPYRGFGLGRIFYCDVTSYAELRVPLLACEVFLEPRDDVAVLFHGTYGFNEVGQQLMAGVGLPVSLLAKSLCSYEFVRDTYLKSGTGKLPDQPWLAERAQFQPGQGQAQASRS